MSKIFFVWIGNNLREKQNKKLILLGSTISIDFIILDEYFPYIKFKIKSL